MNSKGKSPLLTDFSYGPTIFTSSGATLVNGAGTVAEVSPGVFRFTVPPGAANYNPSVNAYVIAKAVDVFGAYIPINGPDPYTNITGMFTIKEHAVTSSTGLAWVMAGFVNKTDLNNLGSTPNGLQAFGSGIAYTASDRYKFRITKELWTGGTVSGFLAATGSPLLRGVVNTYPSYNTPRTLFYGNGHSVDASGLTIPGDVSRIDFQPTSFNELAGSSDLYIWMAAGQYGSVTSTQTIDVSLRYSLSRVLV